MTDVRGRVIFAVLMCWSVVPARAQHAMCNDESWEKGDIFWRDIRPDWIFGLPAAGILPASPHSAIYDKVDGAQPIQSDPRFHRLIEQEGPNVKIRPLSLRQFQIDGKEYSYGACKRKNTNLGFNSRRLIVQTAVDLMAVTNPRIAYVQDVLDFIDLCAVHSKLKSFQLPIC